MIGTSTNAILAPAQKPQGTVTRPDREDFGGGKACAEIGTNDAVVDAVDTAEISIGRGLGYKAVLGKGTTSIFTATESVSKGKKETESYSKDKGNASSEQVQKEQVQVLTKHHQKFI